MYAPELPLRRVEVALPDGERFVFLTNHLGFGPTTIARIYKDRWQIELFFKALKQNLRVKTFVGTTANALHIQIWTALIALFSQVLTTEGHFGWSLSNLVALLRMNLLVYRDLWTWLDDPFTAPPPATGAHTGSADLSRPHFGQQHGAIWSKTVRFSESVPSNLDSSDLR